MSVWGYSASSESSLADLEQELKNLNQTQQAFMVGMILYHGLMRCNNLLIRCMLWLMKFRGLPAFLYAISDLQANNPHITEQIWQQTIRHLRHGKDKFDEDSVGGFSQAEINQIGDWLRSLNRVRQSYWSFWAWHQPNQG